MGSGRPGEVGTLYVEVSDTSALTLSQDRQGDTNITFNLTPPARAITYADKSHKSTAGEDNRLFCRVGKPVRLRLARQH